jgi:capsular polysaccharide biosynthesis protein
MSYLITPKGFSEHINYRSPVNMKTEWSHLFQPDYAYKKVKLGARLLHNVFVNHYGLVIKNGLLVKGCAPNIGHTKYEDDNFYYAHWRKASEQWLVAKYGKSIASKKLDDNKTYLVIHSPWFSYYFWITECVPRLLMVKEHLHELILIYPESWKNFNFVNETLVLFPELEREVIQNDVHLFVKNLVMPEVKPWTPMIIPKHIDEIRSLFFNNLKSEKSFISPKKNHYISRADAKYKKVENEHQLTIFLNENDYQTITMTGKSIFEQAKIMQDTKSLVAITGASMANFVFLPPKASVIDLTNEHYVHDRKYKFHFKKILDVIGCDYNVLFCKSIDSDPQSDVATRDISVNIDVLKELL